MLKTIMLISVIVAFFSKWVHNSNMSKYTYLERIRGDYDTYTEVIALIFLISFITFILSTLTYIYFLIP